MDRKGVREREGRWTEEGGSGVGSVHPADAATLPLPAHLSPHFHALLDIAIIPFILGIQRFGATLAAFPNLAKYAEASAARPSVAATFPPHWADTPSPGWLSDAGI